MKRLVLLCLTIISLSGCNEDSSKKESQLKCADRSVEEVWKGEKVIVKSCHQGKLSIKVALSSSGDTVYVMTQLATNLIEVIHYIDNVPDRKTFEVNTASGYVVNQQFKKHEGSGFTDESMLVTAVQKDGIDLCLNKQIADSAIFIGTHKNYLSLFESNKTYKGLENYSFFHDCFDLSKAEIGDNHAVFLVFFSEKDREGFGVMPFYMDSTLAYRSDG